MHFRKNNTIDNYVSTTKINHNRVNIFQLKKQLNTFMSYFRLQ